MNLNRKRGRHHGVRNVLLAGFFFAVVFGGWTTRAWADGTLTVVAQVVKKQDALDLGPLEITAQGKTARATAQEYARLPKQIALILDASANQGAVLAKEKELAVALVSELARDNPAFIVGRASLVPTLYPATSDSAIAIEYLRSIEVDRGKKGSVPIYDAIGLALEELAKRPGIRVVIFIGEGNDSGSKLRYEGLRDLAQSQHIVCFAALLADHPLRGTKSILRYGWSLRELAGDTAGAFFENQKPEKVVREVAKKVRSLQLLTFEMTFPKPGRYRIAVASRSSLHLRVQKAVVIGL